MSASLINYGHPYMKASLNPFMTDNFPPCLASTINWSPRFLSSLVRAGTFTVFLANQPNVTEVQQKNIVAYETLLFVTL